MRFTVIGHSCLYIETSAADDPRRPVAVRVVLLAIVVALPAVAGAEPEWLAPDYVYLTHHHFDHFHYPSMRRIDRDAHVLVPEFGVDVLAGEVRNLGFDEVMELPHAQVVQLGPDVRVASYQYGTDDTVFVVADGDDVLVDINDSKIRGRTLDLIRAEFGRPTFVFKSYSFAQAYPVLLHRRRSRRPRADHPGHLPRRLDRCRQRAGAGLRRPVRQHGRVPAPREPPGRTST